MRRLGLLGCVLGKVFGRGLSAEGLAGLEYVELVGEGADPSVDALEVVGGKLPCGVELVALGAVVALDVAVELGRSGRQFEELDAAPCAFGLEVGLELRSAIDLDDPDGEGHVGLELVEEPLGVVSAGAPEGPGAKSTWRRGCRR